MKNKAKLSRRIFFKHLAFSTAAVAVGTNFLFAERRVPYPNKAIKVIPRFPNKAVSVPPSDPKPLNQISWDTLRGHFRMNFNLDPAADTTWEEIKRVQQSGYHVV
jgi:secreted PhoX family phosphatase